MITFNTLIGCTNARIYRQLAVRHRQPVVSVAVPEGNHFEHAAAARISYFGTLVVTGSYRDDGEIAFRS